MGLLAIGCVPLSQVQTADTLGRGNFQFAVEPGMGGATVLTQGNSTSFTYPHVDVAFRYGVLDRLDLGVRAGSSLVELQSKFLLTPPGDPDLAISVAPSVIPLVTLSDDEGFRSRSTHWMLPVLVGFKTENGSEFVLGTRAQLTRVSYTSDGVSSHNDIFSIGGSLGCAIRVSNRLRVMPEVGLSFPVGLWGSKVNAEPDGGFLQVKFGLLFGTGRPLQRQEELLPDDSWEEPATSDDPQEDSTSKEEPPALEADPSEEVAPQE